MFCDEKILKVYFREPDGENEDGYCCWFDCHHGIAFHTTEGFGMVFETENYMISLGADGVSKSLKSEFTLIDGEILEIDSPGSDDYSFINYTTVIFTGERLLSVEKNDSNYTLVFDDFSMQLFVYEAGKLNLSCNKNFFSYSYIYGCDRHLKRKCVCGGNGDVLINSADYTVRCDRCDKATSPSAHLPDAIDKWNNGELLRVLDNIPIE